MSKHDDLVKKLKEIFQIDRPELDFGIYRILNARAGEITDYLENRLKAKVGDSLAVAGTLNLEDVQKELSEKEAQYRADGIDLANVPKVRELRQKLVTYSVSTSDYENAVFSHLLTFFSRYYDNGDFISQRRYKGDTYAIPYAGEEVMLHWANKDQYYTKSGENFSNYGFKLDDGQGVQRTVRFRLVTADTAKDNRKDNDKVRSFQLIAPHTRTLIDDEGDEYEESLVPVEEITGADGKQELVLRFQYVAMPKGTKQDTLVLDAVTKVLADEAVKARWLDLGKREPTETNPHRTLLEKCLTSYTTKNSADYFIHKDLGGFLRRELDFYIKNEVMHLDDVQQAEKFADIEKSLRLIQTLRAIALDLVSFLAQLEDFQKKLWLKKKFVVATHYCVTLDRVPESVYPVIAASAEQWEQWEKLGMLDGEKGDLFNQAKAGSVEYLKAHPYLMADTALFDATFKHTLLAAMHDLDESLDGLLIHGDNFQALGFLGETFKGQVSCIHIDPPYNTDTSGFAYKNNYRHSSWLALMEGRVQVSLPLLAANGQYICHIDENEYESLHSLFNGTGLENAGTIIWDKRNPMNGGSGVAMQHEYIIWRSASRRLLSLPNDSALAMINKVQELMRSAGGVTDAVRKSYATWLNSNTDLSGGEKAYRYIDTEGKIYQSVSLRAPEPRADSKFHLPLIHPVTHRPCAVPPNGFSRTPETLQTMVARGDILFGEDETTQPRQKVVLTIETTRQLSSLIQDAKKGKAEASAMGLGFPYCHPTSLYELIVSVATGSRQVVLDYFAGSGTTGHAVISVNRKDGCARKYILVEQGEYFDTVTKPRIQKVVYSSGWKDGKATAPQTGISHAFKVLKLESYEDTLNNLQLRRTTEQQSLLDNLPKSANEDYLLNYLLDIESRGSLLSVEQFKKPFDCKLKVAVDSAGAYEEKTIDLVETFNYLIGLRVKHIDVQREQGFVSITGWLPTGEKTLVLWRDLEKVDYEALTRLCNKLAINPADSEFEIVYINGDHNIPSVFTSLETEGGITKTLKLRQIEPEFLQRMFATEDA
jgi:adenine-specific DNA-methyltransferase